MPGDGDLLKLTAAVMQRGQQLHVKGKAMNLQRGGDALVSRARDELEPALAVVDGDAQQRGHQRAKDAPHQPALPLALHTGARLIPAGGKQRRLRCGLLACQPDEMRHLGGGA